STTGGCQFFGRRLISWQCKKQTIVATSTTELEYVAAAHYCRQTEENAEFHQIVDFLSTCSINYALTVSPTIYASYIEQFWNTAISKIVNSVKQIHAIVDGKAVVISESSVRSDLLFNDEDQPFNDTYETPKQSKKVFSNMARKSINFSGNVTPLFDSMLVQNQASEGEGSVIPTEPQPTPSTSQPNILETQTAPLQAATHPIVSHELQAEAHIEQILPSPSTYQRKHRKTHKPRKAKKVTELP
nr:putative reverse transcriptase, RNA-dependent DNA polymerase [Tanacetum cinerariifolium]